MTDDLESLKQQLQDAFAEIDKLRKENTQLKKNATPVSTSVVLTYQHSLYVVVLKKYFADHIRRKQSTPCPPKYRETQKANHYVSDWLLYDLVVGAVGFEPTASCSQGRRANQAALRPDSIEKGSIYEIEPE